MGGRRLPAGRGRRSRRVGGPGLAGDVLEAAVELCGPSGDLLTRFTLRARRADAGSLQAALPRDEELPLHTLVWRAHDAPEHPATVPGMLWLSIAFVGALTLSRVFERERETDTFAALLVAPVERLALYLAKLFVTFVVLMFCCGLLVPGLALTFPGADGFFAEPVATMAVVALGAFGYAAVGTLFAAGLTGQGGKNVLMTVILYPLTTPILMFGLVTTRRVLEGHPDMWSTLRQFAALDIGLVAVAALLFESVVVGVSRPREKV